MTNQLDFGMLHKEFFQAGHDSNLFHVIMHSVDIDRAKNGIHLSPDRATVSNGSSSDTQETINAELLFSETTASTGIEAQTTKYREIPGGLIHAFPTHSSHFVDMRNKG